MTLTLLHSEGPKLCRVLALLNATGLRGFCQGGLQRYSYCSSKMQL